MCVSFQQQQYLIMMFINYINAAMGIPGSSEILKELTSHVFGVLLAEGLLVIIADDLFIGGNTIEEMLFRWKLVLQRLRYNNLTLSLQQKTLSVLKQQQF